MVLITKAMVLYLNTNCFCLCWVVGLRINVEGIHVFIVQGFGEFGSLQRGTSGWLVFD